MAAIPAAEPEIAEKFGPRLAYAVGSDPRAAAEPDRLVKTHCCFCGQQCGIQLKVKGNQVVGFEPWEEFPFNRGMLCPKGVKRYLQGSHPDRLLSAYERDPSARHGFVPVAYHRAIEKAAEAIQRIQSAHGAAAFAVLSGASLTTEKAYLMGKFARVCLKTPHIDYNGRLCMVSAAAANKKAFGIDRAANPWSDIPKAEVVWVSGANIAECAPITTHYIWQAREHGAKIIMVDPRITPAARTCDLFLPVKPGRDIALFNGILHLMIENDWIDYAFIEEHTIGFDKVAEHVRDWTPARTAAVTGIAERSIRQAAELWGTAATSFLLHARSIEHHSHGVQNCLGAINMVLASGRIGREGCGYATITGQANGQGGREHGQKCDQLPGMRNIENPEHRAHVAAVWGVDPAELPHSGVDSYEIFRKIDRGEIRGLLSICFNPKVSLPDGQFIEKMLDKLEFYVAIDFFLNETARHANIILPGSLQEEDEGTVTQIEGRVIKINKAVNSPGGAREDWRIIQDIAAKLGRPRGFTFTEPRGIFEELRHLRRRDRRLFRHHLRTAGARTRRLLAVPQRGPSWHTAPLRGRRPEPHRQGKRPFLFPRRQSAVYRRAVHAAGRGRGRRLSDHSHHRPRRQPVPFRRADAAHRTARGSMPRTVDRNAPTAGGENWGRRRRLGDGRIAPWLLHPADASRDDDSAGHRVRAVPLGRREEHQPRHHRGAGPDLENPGVQGVCGSRSERRAAARPVRRLP